MDKKNPQPTGLSIHSLTRAINSGYRPDVKIKPERVKLYLSAHARRRLELSALIPRSRKEG